MRIEVAPSGAAPEKIVQELYIVKYDSKLKLNRAALLADWFPFAGTFRFTDCCFLH